MGASCGRKRDGGDDDEHGGVFDSAYDRYHGNRGSDALKKSFRAVEAGAVLYPECGLSGAAFVFSLKRLV